MKANLAYILIDIYVFRYTFIFIKRKRNGMIEIFPSFLKTAKTVHTVFKHNITLNCETQYYTEFQILHI